MSRSFICLSHVIRHKYRYSRNHLKFDRLHYTHMCHMMEFSGTVCIQNKVHTLRHLYSRIQISRRGLNLTKLNKEPHTKRCQVAVAHYNETVKNNLSAQVS